MIQDRTGVDVRMEVEHNKIHEGVTYYTGEIKQSISAGGNLYYGLVTGDKEIHIRPSSIVTSGDKVTYQTFKGSAFHGGSALTVLNRNQVDPQPNTASWVKAPTVDTEGTVFAEAYLPGSTGIGGTRSGSSLGAGEEYILPPNSKFLMKFTNESSAANLISWSITWYEE